MFYINNEPTIAAEARKLILEEFSDLEFYEEVHKYLLHGRELPSVSGIPHRFERYPFDQQKQAAAYAARHGQTADYWIRQWECNSFRATTLGTKTHGHYQFVLPPARRHHGPDPIENDRELRRLEAPIAPSWLPRSACKTKSSHDNVTASFVCVKNDDGDYIKKLIIMGYGGCGMTDVQTCTPAQPSARCIPRSATRCRRCPAHPSHPA